MYKKVLKFDDPEIEKSKFHHHNSSIFIFNKQYRF